MVALRAGHLEEMLVVWSVDQTVEVWAAKMAAQWERWMAEPTVEKKVVLSVAYLVVETAALRVALWVGSMAV